MKYLNNERGNTLLIIVGLLVASIFISFVFFDFFTTFATKRMSQTGADSASLAAAHEAKDIYEEDLRETITDRMEDFKEGITGADMEEDGNSSDEDSNGPPDEITEAWLALVLPKLDEIFTGPIGEAIAGKMIPNDLKEWLVDEDAEVDANDTLKYLFKEEEVNEVVCSSIDSNFDRIRAAAEAYAETNDTEINEDIIYPYENQFRVYVPVDKQAHFVTVDGSMFSGDADRVTADAAATIKPPEGFTIQCN